jgi:hypothetical protein
MLAVLGGLADVERDLIRTRTSEGRSRAKARGKHMGRPYSLTPRSNRKRPPDGARRALRCGNWPTATTAAFPPCAVLRALHERDRFPVKRRWFRVFMLFLVAATTLLTSSPMGWGAPRDTARHLTETQRQTARTRSIGFCPAKGEPVGRGDGGVTPKESENA